MNVEKELPKKAEDLTLDQAYEIMATIENSRDDSYNDLDYNLAIWAGDYMSNIRLLVQVKEAIMPYVKEGCEDKVNKIFEEKENEWPAYFIDDIIASDGYEYLKKELKTYLGNE